MIVKHELVGTIKGGFKFALGVSLGAALGIRIIHWFNGYFSVRN